MSKPNNVQILGIFGLITAELNWSHCDIIPVAMGVAKQYDTMLGGFGMPSRNKIPGGLESGHMGYKELQ